MTDNKQKTRGMTMVKLLLFLLVMQACDPGRVYEEHKAVSASGWRSKDVLCFQPRITDTSMVANVIIFVRHKGNYSYNNLYLFVTISSPSHRVVRDTIQLFLADASTGKWYGKSMLGDLYLLGRMYKKHVRFAEQGMYHFYIEQAMRMRNLPGITDVGLRIERVQ